MREYERCYSRQKEMDCVMIVKNLVNIMRRRSDGND